MVNPWTNLRGSFYFAGRPERTSPASDYGFKKEKAATREADLSTEQPSAQADARLPGTDAHAERPRGYQPPAAEGAEAPQRLMAQLGRAAVEPVRATGERLTSLEKVRRRTEYLRCYRGGRRRHGSLAIVYYVPNQQGVARMGITASRKVGSAVVRVRLKRRIREIYRRWEERARLPALDLIVHLKPEAGKSDFATLRQELVRLWGALLERRPAP
jgi:ribonuclease P protein component